MASQSRELASAYDATLDPFTVHVHALADQYPKEFEKYCLDEFIVAAIAPLVWTHSIRV
jgi:tuftelin-interacting protein 11